MMHRETPAITLADAATLRMRLREQIESRQWWIVVSADGAGDDFLADVEHHHYRGHASDDFELAILPPGVLAPCLVTIVCAHKRRMGVGALLRCLKRFISDPGEVAAIREALPMHDILFPGVTDVRALSMQFLAFVDPAGAVGVAARN